MATPVEVPKLGNTVEECFIGRWLKHRGDAVSEGEVVAEIETDKATFEVTAPVSGTVLETFFEEGTLVPVFTNLLVIGNAGESADAFRPQANGAAVAAPAAKPVGPAEAPAPVQKAAVAAGPLSPRARQFARDHDFHPPQVAGSGPGGRVLEADLKTLYDSAAARPAAVSRMRETIARRMRESLATTAQYTLHASADAGGLLMLRARVKASVGVPDININDMVAYCTVQALREAPSVNAEFSGGKLVEHPEVHLAFACDTPRGLMVPVIRGAHRLGPAELAAKMKELTAQAVQGAISADDLTGGTFTISNLGSLGIESFTPILNPPQVAILGVDAIQLKPVRHDGRVEFIDAIGFSLTCDHQVVDGAPGARFLKTLREKIENVEKVCQI